MGALALAVAHPADSSPGAAGGAVRVLPVGPSRALRTVADAARVATDGDVVEVDAGEYVGDCAVWAQERLVIVAVGGRVVLRADGRSAEGKGIWVMRGGNVHVAGFDFTGARVPERNGAGIRFEKGRLSLADCRFVDNENGILTAQDADSELEVESCEFGHNGAGDGYSHNLYVGRIRRLKVTGCYFHHARTGHLLKSRAAENHILYNRLSDEEGGRASYELEFPNGGIARVLGNIVQQGARTENPVLISFGAEGYLPRANALYLAHNTLVDDAAPNGRFLAIRDGDRRVVAVNNVLVGDARFEVAIPGEVRNNPRVPRNDFAAPEQHDYRLKRTSRAFGSATRVAPVAEGGLFPQAEYVHPRSIRTLGGLALQPGALQSAAD